MGLPSSASRHPIVVMIALARSIVILFSAHGCRFSIRLPATSTTIVFSTDMISSVRSTCWDITPCTPGPVSSSQMYGGRTKVDALLVQSYHLPPCPSLRSKGARIPRCLVLGLPPVCRPAADNHDAMSALPCLASPIPLCPAPKHPSDS